MNLLQTESYEDVLSSGRRRKRPKLAGGVNDLSTLVATAEVRRHETVSFFVKIWNIFRFRDGFETVSVKVRMPCCMYLGGRFSFPIGW